MGRSEELNIELRERSKAAILQAAMQLFAQKGYEKTSISAIAQAAGVAKGLVYNYFQSKEHLLEEVVLYGLQQMAHTLEGIEEATPAGMMDIIVEQTCQALESQIEFWKLYIALVTQVHAYERMRHIFENMMQGAMQTIRPILERLGVQNAEYHAKSFAATLDGMAIHYIFFGDAYPLRQVGEAVKTHYQLLIEKSSKPPTS